MRKRTLIRQAVIYLMAFGLCIPSVISTDKAFAVDPHYVFLIDAFGNAYEASAPPSNEFPTAGFLSDSQKIIANNYHNAFTIDSLGNLYGIGDNTCGVLGDPNVVGNYRSTANQIMGIESVVDVAEINVVTPSGSNGSAVFALKSDGSVWSWGCNEFLAYETSVDQEYYSDPQPISTLNNITQLESGKEHVLALSQDGSIYGWGNNACGQIGIEEIGGTNYCEPGPIVSNPQLVVGIDNATKIATGYTFSAALLADGTVKQWGKMNTIEGLGAVFPKVSTPQSINISDVGRIIAGSYALYMQKTDNTVYGLGSDSFSSLGATSESQPRADGQFYTTEPVPVTALNGSVQLWAGEDIVVGSIGNQLVSLGGRGRCLQSCDPSSVYEPYILSLDPAIVVDMAILRGDVNYILTNSTSLRDETPPVLGIANWTNNPKRLDQQSTLTIPVTDDKSGVAGGEGFICGSDPGEHNGFPFNFNGTELSFFVDESAPEGTYDICYRAFDNAGNVSTIGQTTLYVGDNFDLSPPVITGTPDRAPNTNGWYNAPVTINWASVDPTPSSGLPTTPPAIVANLEGVNTYTSAQSCDPSNNCATGSYEVKLDSVLPGGSFTGTQAVIRMLGRTIAGSASDVTSGVAQVQLTAGNTTLTSDANGGLVLSCDAAHTSCSWTATANRLPTGVNTYTLTITDLAGNVFTTTRQYTVI